MEQRLLVLLRYFCLMRIFRTLLLAVYFLYAEILAAQQPDTLASIISPNGQPAFAITATDSAFVQISGGKTRAMRRFFTKNYPNPRKAALFGIIPGGGQVYNKKWWKLPIVYGALGGMLWWELDNLKTYRELRDNYLWTVDEDPNTVPVDPYSRLDAVSLKKYRDQFRKYTEQTSLGLGLVYLLTITDAFVDAHLAHFDVSDDLSMRVLPRVQTVSGFGPAFGIGIQVQLGARRPAYLRDFSFSQPLSAPLP